MSPFRRVHPLLLLPLLLLGLLTGCNKPDSVISAQFLAFGTLTEVQISTPNENAAKSAIRLIEADFQAMHKEWHAWQTGPLTITNDGIHTGMSFTVHSSVLELIKRSIPLAATSDNLFNPAIGKLVALWGFHSSEIIDRKPPTAQAIAALVQRRPQLSDLQLSGNTMRSTNTAVDLDFGAIGKGWGIDKAMQHLSRLGIENAVINSGGDLKVIGKKADKPWRIAVRHPSGDGILGYLQSEGTESYFTSGDYERRFTWKGQQYHHIIDPRTGYPATGTRSVTVIHPEAVIADAAATALFVAGPENWYRIARQMGIKYVLLVDTENRLHMNPKMQTRLQLRDENHVIVLSEPLE